MLSPSSRLKSRSDLIISRAEFGRGRAEVRPSLPRAVSSRIHEIQPLQAPVLRQSRAFSSPPPAPSTAQPTLQSLAALADSLTVGTIGCDMRSTMTEVPTELSSSRGPLMRKTRNVSLRRSLVSERQNWKPSMTSSPQTHIPSEAKLSGCSSTFTTHPYSSNTHTRTRCSLHSGTSALDHQDTRPIHCLHHRRRAFPLKPSDSSPSGNPKTDTQLEALDQAASACLICPQSLTERGSSRPLQLGARQPASQRLRESEQVSKPTRSRKPVYPSHLVRPSHSSNPRLCPPLKQFKGRSNQLADMQALPTNNMSALETWVLRAAQPIQRLDGSSVPLPASHDLVTRRQASRDHDRIRYPRRAICADRLDDCIVAKAFPTPFFHQLSTVCRRTGICLFR
ncbi:unnamed protein product [Protopolystoma xenopodis]|uniref:Uncharacterized protein n=1 Tax=Protopolystoma xenopodis TaxID=117903 RepID=A0A3S5A901_9PLAT|nr:unnamed protein product [Protopolystoma xenopodis]